MIRLIPSHPSTKSQLQSHPSTKSQLQSHPSTKSQLQSHLRQKANYKVTFDKKPTTKSPFDKKPTAKSPLDKKPLKTSPSIKRIKNLETSDGVPLELVYYPPKGKALATVILVHDLNGSEKTLQRLAIGLQENGCAVAVPTSEATGEAKVTR